MLQLEGSGCDQKRPPLSSAKERARFIQLLFGLAFLFSIVLSRYHILPLRVLILSLGKVLSERHFPITPTYNETRSGVCLTIDGTEFTPEELVAMVLTHARDITDAYGTPNVRDCVLTVPSFFTQHERKALLDAAKLANLNVLALIDENTAAALHFGIDRIDEEPKNVVFYNMGASSLQVSVVKYHSYEKLESKFSKKGKPVGSFEVLSKGWDSTLGGQAFDARIVDHMADEFNVMWDKKRDDGQKKDVRVNARAMAKLRVQANKVKHVLSANNDFPIFIDALYDDTNYHSHLDRATFEQICHDLLLRAGKPITQALEAAGLTLEEVDEIELIGGGMRVPRVQEELSKVLGDKELGMHINSDESMALGAAFHGANVSTAFRVRHVGMTDVNPFPIAIDLNDLEVEEAPEKKDGEEAWSKHATLFKSFGKIGVKKTIAFSHDADVFCGIDYEESDFLPEGTEHSIERYNVTGIAAFAKEMAEKDLAKPKVSLQFEMSSSGIASLIKAEAVVEENVTIAEEVLCKDDEEDEECKPKEEGKKEENATDATEGDAEDGDAKGEADAEAEAADAKEGDDEKKDETADTAEGEKKDGNETKEEEKKEKKVKKYKMVEKQKKKVHRRTLVVNSFHVGRIRPYSPEILAESEEKLAALARADKERMMLEEAKNKVESYIYQIKNKLIDDDEAVAKVTNEAQREEVKKLADDAEEWMYEDGYDADLPTFEEKYVELSTPFEKILFRLAEIEARPEAIASLTKKLGKVEELMTKWETEKPHITEDERKDVLTKVEDVRKWIAENEEKQAATAAHEDPAFVSADVPLQTKDLEKLVGKLAKRPVPKPPKVEKKEEEKKSEDGDETKTEGESEDKKEEGEASASDEATEDTGDDEL